MTATSEWLTDFARDLGTHTRLFVREAIAQAVAPLEARIAELESRLNVAELEIKLAAERMPGDNDDQQRRSATPDTD